MNKISILIQRMICICVMAILCMGMVTEAKREVLAASELKDIGKGYSLVSVDREEYRIKKESYILIKKQGDNGGYKYSVEDLEGNIIFHLGESDTVWDVLLGKKDVYFAVDGENYRGIVKLNIKSKKAVPVPDTDDTAGFGSSFYDKKSGKYKTKYFYKDWIYLQLMEGDSDPGMCMLNLKTGKVMYAPEYFIKGKVLYYGVVEKNDYNSIKLYKSNLDFTNSKYIGKYKKDWSKGQLLGISKVDGGYVYYHTLKHEGMSSKEITVKFKIKK